MPHFAPVGCGCVVSFAFTHHAEPSTSCDLRVGRGGNVVEGVNGESVRIWSYRRDDADTTADGHEGGDENCARCEVLPGLAEGKKP